MKARKIYFLSALISGFLTAVFAANAQPYLYSKERLINVCRPASSGFITKVPFEFVNGAIIIKVKVGPKKRECRFVIDNSRPSAITYKISREEGLEPIRDWMTIGKVDPNEQLYTLIDEISIGDVAFKNVGAQITGFASKVSSYERCYMRDIDGIIGGGVLPVAIWHFDFPNRELTITDDLSKLPQEQESFTLPFAANTSTGRIELIDPMFFEKYEMKDTRVELNNACRISAPEKAYEKLNEKRRLRCVKGNAYLFQKDDTVFQKGKQYYALPFNFKVGPLYYDNLLVEFSKQQKTHAVIGTRFMERYRITFDYLAQNIYLAANKDQKHEQSLFTYGFKYTHSLSENKMIVSMVLENSPAERAEIQVGDQIIKINGIDFTTAVTNNYCRFPDPDKIGGNLDKLEIEFKTNHGEIRKASLIREEILKNEF